MNQQRTRGDYIDQCEKALAEAESKVGKESTELCPILDELGTLYHVDGLYAKAELLHKRSADILAKSGTPEQLCEALSRLGLLYRAEEKFDDAEAVYLRALAILDEKPENARLRAARLSCLAGLFVQRKQFDQAQELLKKASDLYDQSVGEQNSFSRFCNLAIAWICGKQGKHSEAEDALSKSQVGLGEVSKDDRALLELANAYYQQNRLAEVEMIVNQVVLADEERVWPDHPRVGQAYHDRGELFRAQGLYNDAEKAYKRAIEIRQKVLGIAHPELAYSALSLAAMYLSQNRNAEAEPVLKLALKTRVRAFGVEHPSVAACIETYASLLKKTKRPVIGAKLESRARDIRSRLVWNLDKTVAR